MSPTTTTRGKLGMRHLEKSNKRGFNLRGPPGKSLSRIQKEAKSNPSAETRLDNPRTPRGLGWE